MKKFLSLLLCLLMVFPSLAAIAEAATEPEVVIPEGRIVVDYWCIFSGDNGEYLNSVVDAFNKSQDKYFVVRQYCGSYMEGLAKMQMGEVKDRPALMTFSAEMVGTYKYSGLGIPFHEVVADDDPLITDLEKYLLNIWGDNDGLLGWPLGNSMCYLAINTEMAEKAGFDPKDVTSMEALYDACVKIKAAYPDMKHVIGCDHGSIYINHSLSLEGVPVLNNDNGVTGIATDLLIDESPAKEAVEKYMQICQDMAKQDMWYPLGASWGGEVLPAGATGEIAIITGPMGGYSRILRAVRAAQGEDAKSPFTLVPYPSLTKSESEINSMPATGTGYFLIDNGNPDATAGALEYIRFIAQDEYYTGWLKQTGYVPNSPKSLKDEEFVKFIDEDRPECWHIINLAGSKTGGIPHPVMTIYNEWIKIWITCMEKVCFDTNYDVAQAVAELNVECQDALDIWLMSNGY